MAELQNYVQERLNLAVRQRMVAAHQAPHSEVPQPILISHRAQQEGHHWQPHMQVPMALVHAFEAVCACSVQHALEIQQSHWVIAFKHNGVREHGTCSIYLIREDVVQAMHARSGGTSSRCPRK